MTRLQIESTLKTLRSKEITQRAALVDSLRLLACRALRAADKIESRDWEDGLACIDSDIADFHGFQDDLETVISDIKFAEWELDDCDEAEAC